MAHPVAHPQDVLALYEWNSSYKVGSRWESDLLLSSAIDTCGLMFAQTEQFLAQLGIPHASRQTLFKTQRKVIAPVVVKLGGEELAAVVHQTNAKASAKVQIDEQHSRPQKSAATIGAAPFVTATAINDDELIVSVTHEDATDNKDNKFEDQLGDLLYPRLQRVRQRAYMHSTTSMRSKARSVRFSCTKYARASLFCIGMSSRELAKPDGKVFRIISTTGTMMLNPFNLNFVEILLLLLLKVFHVRLLDMAMRHRRLKEGEK